MSPFVEDELRQLIENLNTAHRASSSMFAELALVVFESDPAIKQRFINSASLAITEMEKRGEPVVARKMQMILAQAVIDDD